MSPEDEVTLRRLVRFINENREQIISLGNKAFARWDAWSDGYSTGVVVAGYQVDIRWGRDPWMPLSVREGDNEGFGKVRQLWRIGALTYGPRAGVSRRFRTRPVVEDVFDERAGLGQKP